MTAIVTIGDIAERTGVAEGTLRMWESRHGFPVPERLSSGHRRYSEHDIELVRQVASERAAGIPLPTAIEHAMRNSEAPARSLYAALRQRRPDLEPRRLTKRMMLALSYAIEDESLSRAERPLLFGCFQRERYYRRAEARWRELTRTAQLTIAFADFDRMRTPRGGPIEIPVGPDDPLVREWAIVCDAPRHGVCLIAWEPPASTIALGERYFESLWSVEPSVVREAAQICADMAAARQPSSIEAARSRLAEPPTQPADKQLVLATAITNRTLSYID